MKVLGTGNGGKLLNDCDCHDKLNVVVSHYFGITLLATIGASILLAMSAKAKDSAVISVLQSFGQLQVLIAGAMAAIWGTKGQKEKAGAAGTKGDPTHTEIVNKPNAPVPTVEADKEKKDG